MTPTLVLFDIDGTLLRSQGAGVASMQRTFDELFPTRSVSMEGIPVAGRLDTLIWNDVMARAGIERTDVALAEFRARYAAILDARLRNGTTVVTMPGVRELVSRLDERDDVVVGLLTGNWPDTAKLKVSAAGFDFGRFRLGAFAGDGPDRRSLPPVALQRFEELLARDTEPSSVVIIGDTPHDVDCAKFNGCRAIAVATGGATLDALEATDADLVVETLADYAAIERWIVAAAG